MTDSGSSGNREPGSRVILEFDREVTDEEVKQMQAQHNATSAFQEPRSQDDPDVIDMGEVDDVIDMGEVDDVIDMGEVDE
ncbi:hypothetical protein SLA_4149 [Streptomyces laurentii]|uniref:Uncharacterized protein n=1 Tax=Streptomyces laurentii TaxID=39478 RepID=A0A160P0Y2_STRLU|nr:hypothetical protein SLA_4149 [Streptomyces laurentii]